MNLDAYIIDATKSRRMIMGGIQDEFKMVFENPNYNFCNYEEPQREKVA